MDAWVRGISSVPPAFDYPPKSVSLPGHEHMVHSLRAKIDRCIAIVDREGNKINRSIQSSFSATKQKILANEGIVAALRNTYEGPGELRPQGPRHDNDFVDIQQIRTAPTHEELTSSHVPYLPANLYDAPHHLPAECMERLLDIQFRLLREELTYVYLIHSTQRWLICAI